MASLFQSFHGGRTKGTVSAKPTSTSLSSSYGGAGNTALVTNILRQYAQATLGAGSLQTAVLLPEGEDEHEWIAVHVHDFCNQINLLYGTITEFCVPHSNSNGSSTGCCSRMMATEDYEYLWQDPQDPRYHRPTAMPARDYIDCLIAWCHNYLDNETIFPTQPGISFSSQSLPIFKIMLKRLFRVYAHIYCHHFNQITELGLQPHLNTSLKHFVLFTRQFDLVDPVEFAPLQELITILLNDN
jgi:MOB kinase activator 1